MNHDNSRKALIVDSDEVVLIALERLLESDGIGTTTTWSGQQALELLKSDGFDLLLIGDRVTELSCEQLLREIQRQGSSALILVMESAGSRAPSTAQYFASLGAAATVRKREYGKVLETAKALLANQLGTPARAA
jgi:DNA-binding NtrC family response regulator